MFLVHIVMCPYDTDRMANSVDPNQTADVGLLCPDLSV